jgi:AraC family transcriptional regulator
VQRKPPAGNHEFYGEVARSSLTKDLTFTEATYPPRFSTPPHAHRIAYFCLILEGMSLQRFERRERLLRPFTSYYCPAGEVHSESHGESNGRELIIGFCDSWLERVHDCPRLPTVSLHFEGGMAAWLAMRVRAELLRPDSASPLALEGLALEILAVVARQSASRPPRGASTWLAAAEGMLRERLSEPLSLSDQAAAVGVHPVHLAREFRKRYGCSAGEYVRKLRVELAREWLVTSESTLSNIAHRAGFCDQSHFARTFKRLTGMTPTEFRAAARVR